MDIRLIGFVSAVLANLFMSVVVGNAIRKWERISEKKEELEECSLKESFAEIEVTEEYRNVCGEERKAKKTLRLCVVVSILLLIEVLTCLVLFLIKK